MTRIDAVWRRRLGPTDGDRAQEFRGNSARPLLGLGAGSRQGAPAQEARAGAGRRAGRDGRAGAAAPRARARAGIPAAVPGAYRRELARPETRLEDSDKLRKEEPAAAAVERRRRGDDSDCGPGQL